MPNVRAEVPEEVQRALNMEAAMTDGAVYQIAGQELIDWYEQSDYSPDENND